MLRQFLHGCNRTRRLGLVTQRLNVPPAAAVDAVRAVSRDGQQRWKKMQSGRGWRS
jgi:hypothetical protein